MGLDQYLFKLKKKCDDQEELDSIQELRGVQALHFKTFDLLLEGKKEDAVKAFFTEYYVEKYLSGDKEVIDRLDKDLDNLKILVLKYNEELSKGNDYSKLNPNDIGYWRKHHDLQEYMEDLYSSRGGNEVFNCVDLLLSKEDCDSVIDYSKSMIIKIASGNGVDYAEDPSCAKYDIENWTDTIGIFDKAIKETDWDNETVYYSSWW